MSPEGVAVGAALLPVLVGGVIGAGVGTMLLYGGRCAPLLLHVGRYCVWYMGERGLHVLGGIAYLNSLGDTTSYEVVHVRTTGHGLNA